MRGVFDLSNKRRFHSFQMKDGKFNFKKHFSGQKLLQELTFKKN